MAIISLNPTSATPGQFVSVTGSGFSALFTPYTIYLRNSSGIIIETVGGGLTDTLGNISAAFAIPSIASAGSYTVTVTDNFGATDTKPLTITGTSSQVTITIPIGTIYQAGTYDFSATGAGIVNASGYYVSLLPAAGISATQNGNLLIASNGTIRWTWNILQSATPGTYTIFVANSAGQTIGQRSFTITQRPVSVFGPVTLSVPTKNPSGDQPINQSFTILSSITNTGTQGGTAQVHLGLRSSSGFLIIDDLVPSVSIPDFQLSQGATVNVGFNVPANNPNFAAGQVARLQVWTSSNAVGNDARNIDVNIVVATGGGDNVLPSVSITSPGNSTTISLPAGATTTNIPVTGSASDNVALSKVETSIDNQAYVLVNGTSNWSITYTGVTVGTHTITARATDTTGNQKTSTNTVSVVPTAGDTTLPNITITAPLVGQVFNVGNTVNVVGTALDNVALSKVEIKLDNGGFMLASGLQNWSFAFVNATAGTHTITARATDTSGNTRDAILSFTVTTAGGTPPPSSNQLALYAAIAAGAVLVGYIALDSLGGEPKRRVVQRY